jgi:hypothetical protein
VIAFNVIKRKSYKKFKKEMHICAKFWLFAAFGVLFGLAVAGFGVGLYNRQAAQTSTNLLYQVQLDTSVAIQNITRINESIILLNTSVSALNLTEIAQTLETVYNVTRDLYQPFVQLFERAIFSFNGNTTRPVANNVDLEGRFGIIVNGWNVNGSVLQTQFDDIETELGPLQTLIQVQLTNELVMLENNALRSVNSVVFPDVTRDSSINFTGSCNMTVDDTLGVNTITFRTCSTTPNAYNCSLQLTQTQDVLVGINQTLNQVISNITIINTELTQIQANINNASLGIVSLNAAGVKVFGPHVTWTNGTNMQVSTNASGIYLSRTGGIDGFSNTFNQSTTSRQVSFVSGSPGSAVVTSNNVNTVTVGVSSATDNMCVQFPKSSLVGINVFLGTVSPFLTNVWIPTNMQGGVLGLCPSVFYSWFDTTNCPGFPQDFSSGTGCTDFQGWFQEEIPPSTKWLKFRVPTTAGKVWTIQLKILASITGDPSINNANAITAGLIDPTSFPLSVNCGGPLVGSFASSMNIVTNGAKSYYYYGEITFSTEDPEWVPGRIMYLCVYFSGPGASLSPPALTILPSLMRLA